MIERLSRHEQACLMELLIHLAKSDGKDMDAKKAVLMQYAELIEADANQLKGTLTPKELVPQFQSAASRVIVLQELMRLARIDGHLTIPEESVILDIASMMGLPLSLVQKVEEWVVDGIKWTLRGESLLQEAEHTALRNTAP